MLVQLHANGQERGGVPQAHPGPYARQRQSAQLGTPLNRGPGWFAQPVLTRVARVFRWEQAEHGNLHERAVLVRQDDLGLGSVVAN